MEPWSSRYLTRRSRTTLGETSDVTRRRNTMEGSRLEVQAWNVDRDLQARNVDRDTQARAADLMHEQLVLQRSLTAQAPTPAGRAQGSSSGAALDALRRRERDHTQTQDDKCKGFTQSGRAGRGGGCSESDGGGSAEAQLNGQQTHPHRKHHIPTVLAFGDTAADGDPHAPTLTSVGTAGGRAVGREPRERLYGVARPTDVHLTIEPGDQESKNRVGYSPLRRTNLQQYKLRRTSSVSPNSQHSNSSHGLTATSPRSMHDALDATTRGQGGDVHIHTLAEGNRTSVEDASSVLKPHKKRLPVVLGRQMTRHDRTSKSRESLFLPNLGQGRSPSPVGDLRVKVTCADGGVFSSVADVPFKPHLVRSQKSPLQDSTGLLSSLRGPRLEIDLSIPMASAASNPSSPRSTDRRTSRREKTYTV